QPFYGGTYFPPRAGARGARFGFLDLLQRLDQAYRDEPDRVAAAAADVVARLERAAAPPPGEALPDATVLRHAYAELRDDFDAEHGGVGPAPKFPSPAVLALLLRYHPRTDHPRAPPLALRHPEAPAARGPPGPPG